MDDYRDEVERLACERSGEPFLNSSIDHAAVIIEKVFRHAKSEVLFITKHLTGRVFSRDEVLDEARGFLSNANHKIKILIEDDPAVLSDGHPFVRLLREFPENYTIRQVPEAVKSMFGYHMTLMDDDSYRFEPNKDEWQAVAAFGDKKNAKHLRSVFDSIWHNSEDISIA